MKNTTPSADQPATMSHSCGARVTPVPGRMYSMIMMPDISTAMVPMSFQCFTRYGRTMSGSFTCRMMKDSDTMQYARMHPKLPASTTHMSILRPANGASTLRMPTTMMATYGVLALECSLVKKRGII